MSENELGRYLRTRREALKPADVGLPPGNRHRTPGLRRSELANLAGVSVEYLARLEQGRDRHPSAQVLGALSDALRLPADERFHLRRLAKASGGEVMLCHGGGPPDRTVRPTVQALLDRLEPAPAMLVNRVGDVLAHTLGYQRLAGPVGLLDAGQPNLVRFVFTDARARTAYPEWDRVADEHAAALKLESTLADPHLTELVDELTVTAGAPFTDRMAAPAGPVRRAEVERLAHPEVGALRLARETLELTGTDQRLVVYLPGDDATSAALDRLAGRQPGGLRAVTPDDRRARSADLPGAHRREVSSVGAQW